MFCSTIPMDATPLDDPTTVRTSSTPVNTAAAPTQTTSMVMPSATPPRSTPTGVVALLAGPAGPRLFLAV